MRIRYGTGMPSLRAQKKALRAAEITRAANKLFRSRGYSKTNIEHLAVEAGVSPATIYNYFGTKLNLLHVLMEPEMNRVQQAAATVLANLPEDVLAGIEALTRCYELGPDWLNRDMLMPFAEDFFLSKNSHRNPFSIVSEARARDFHRLFRHYKQQGKLHGDMNEDDAVAIIASLFQYHLRILLFGTRRDGRREDIVGMSYLERRIRFAVSGMAAMAGDRDGSDKSSRSRRRGARSRTNSRASRHGGAA
jgi:AcrR family transcriptional regulator